MLDAVDPAEIPRRLIHVLGPRWEMTTGGGWLEISHRDRSTPFCPPRRSMAWADLSDALTNAFAGQGVLHGAPLPLRWGRDTELTISAIQALDPILKDGRVVGHRSGFIPQPVVRLTGKRDAQGALLDGYLTSFVNASRVESIHGMTDYIDAFDQWVTVLSRLGFHARHIRFYGRLETWQRGQVRGITLRFAHAEIPLGDVVLLWNVDHPQRLVIDVGTSLERLAWARTRRPWSELIFDRWRHAAPVSTLDSLRTATLLLGHGIAPSARGPGNITRRILSELPNSCPSIDELGTFIRIWHKFWNSFSPLQLSWPTILIGLEKEFRHRRPL